MTEVCVLFITQLRDSVGRVTRYHSEYDRFLNVLKINLRKLYFLRTLVIDQEARKKGRRHLTNNGTFQAEYTKILK